MKKTNQIICFLACLMPLQVKAKTEEVSFVFAGATIKYIDKNSPTIVIRLDSRSKNPAESSFCSNLVSRTLSREKELTIEVDNSIIEGHNYSLNPVGLRYGLDRQAHLYWKMRESQCAPGKAIVAISFEKSHLCGGSDRPFLFDFACLGWDGEDEILRKKARDEQRQRELDRFE